MQKRKGIGTRAVLAMAAISIGYMVQYVGDVTAIILYFPLHYVATLGGFGVMALLISRWAISNQGNSKESVQAVNAQEGSWLARLWKNE